MTQDLRARAAFAAIAVVTSLVATTVASAERNARPGWQAVVERDGPAATTPQTETAADLYSDAQMYISLREWAAADRLLRAVLERYPTSVSADYARRDLAKLRRDVFGLSARSALGGPSKPDRGHQPEAIRRSVAPWNILGQRAGLQDQFRSAAGDRLFFAAFSSALGTRNLETLKAQAAWLASRPEARVILEAHSDEPGGTVDATAIAKARGDAIKAAFVAKGISADRIGIVVFGRAKRVALCETPACRAQNRRVVIKVSDAAESREAAAGRR